MNGGSKGPPFLLGHDAPDFQDSHTTRSIHVIARAATQHTTVILRAGGGSSTPRPLGSSISVSGIRDRPVKPDDDNGICVRVLATRIARGLHLVCRPLQFEGAGKTGCAPHPRSRVQYAQESTHTSIQVRRKHPGLPCAMALRLTSCSSRRTALLPPSPPRGFRSLRT
jgi:hypothetical protein